ncbi:FAD/NAD(P)-binding domain-containing protein [Dendrothele bispora CBS 962.96]|uniref:FAD/NAD(P)-binding domain-containing protein n=1 Tax=Dendrothele bispora (strain CBS 962.96) TaxID=1314807 RepID=A0A4S8L996_DENBC|nr:FAD/NAD(P)-binding domain-containing protein [Dendrothele bispora CBS 962.96]THU85299.1 FAD/NAD(P)-binding domain-containing protein [Dendrothele bispora CBS 962.96]
MSHIPDYLKTPYSSSSSFHNRVGEKSEPLVKGFGYPRPGIQSPTPSAATAAHYFVDDATWSAILDRGEFDDVVVGSGHCALAYVDEALKRDPHRKILILERGGFWLPEHFQNPPLPFKMVLGGPSETFPWTLSTETRRIPELGFMHGSCPFFGGRSTFWSAWCPTPTLDLMRSYPKSMMKTAESSDFWEKCKSLLRVTPADQISDQIFAALQTDIDNALKSGCKEGRIGRGEDGKPTANVTEPAPLAVGRTTANSMLAFNKFSTPGPLLALQQRQTALASWEQGSPLMIATDCVVKRFHVDEDQKVDPRPVTILETSRGDLCFPNRKTNLILAAGAIPNTTMLLNSLESIQTRAGKRLTGHFLSHIVARYPMNKDRYGEGHSSANEEKCRINKEKLEIAASYVSGKDLDSEHQYHIQVTAIHSPHPELDAVDAGRECPDYAAAASAEQLEGSEEHIVLVCASLGELDENNTNSWVKRNPQDPDVTTNVKLQVTLTDVDRNLWDVMDKATFDAIEVIARSEAANLEYWHDNSSGDGSGTWKKTKPDSKQNRVPGVVHEASTLYMGPKADSHAAVDEMYRPYGCENVYVTGGAIFPTAGSWNPTLTMCGYAQDLASKIVHPKKS